jgi:hypothetical protein
LAFISYNYCLLINIVWEGGKNAFTISLYLILKSSFLLKINARIRFTYFHSYCNDTHESAGGTIRKTVENYLPELYQPHVLCAGNEAAEDGSCDGDSGGPLLLFSTRTLQYTLVGTIAGGVASTCGDKDFPGVYIRMDHPLIWNWVQDIMLNQGLIEGKALINI